jgi:hypothetical protein
MKFPYAGLLQNKNSTTNFCADTRRAEACESLSAAPVRNTYKCFACRKQIRTDVSMDLHICFGHGMHPVSQWTRVLLEKLMVAQQVKKFPRRFITVFTKRLPLVPCPEPDESSSHTFTIRLKTHFNIILPSTSRSS